MSFSRASNSADPDGSVQVKILMQKKKLNQEEDSVAPARRQAAALLDALTGLVNSS